MEFLRELGRQWIAVAFLLVLLCLGLGWFIYETGAELFCSKDESKASCLRNWLQTIGSLFALIIAIVAAVFTHGQMKAAKRQAVLADIQRITHLRGELRQLVKALKLARRCSSEFRRNFFGINWQLEKISKFGIDSEDFGSELARRYSLIQAAFKAHSNHLASDHLHFNDVSPQYKSLFENYIAVTETIYSLYGPIQHLCEKSYEALNGEKIGDPSDWMLFILRETQRNGEFAPMYFDLIRQLDDQIIKVQREADAIKASLQEEQSHVQEQSLQFSRFKDRTGSAPKHTNQ